VGPRVGLDGCGKSRPHRGFDPEYDGSIVSTFIILWGKNAYNSFAHNLAENYDFHENRCREEHVLIVRVDISTFT
jgi:hypothetical protein